MSTELSRDSDSRATTKPYQTSRKGGVSVKPQWKSHVVPLVVLAGVVQIACMLYLSRASVSEREVKYLSEREVLSRHEFDEVFEKYKKAKEDAENNQVRMVARGVVMGEIERHSADGIGRVDYALASGGGRVTRHSKASGGVWFSGIGWNGIHVDSVKMLRPSFGEPGDCFALSGSSGFVEIKLRRAIVPEAVTLEHVAKSVAYSRSSAPKDCMVSGWFRGREMDSDAAEKKFPLAKFTYDLEKSNAQTFNVSEPAGLGIVDMIRLDFTSNYGSACHTCIYRFRVHGHKPDSSIPVAKRF
ncbi:hypothetical protein DCAR_0623902 [Daucus carota subsp. sativus]|uniref:Uncharacterized protein n=1 Tax=Daucus carota subsp. sativus TaxID=79200 RepID=A0A161YCK2_DAUCS|nr:PREDICTED: protein SAD1/UNC-84 domain protein 1-like [Daucus carota subsp. sativus]WOH04493.1 hypothetical protein DCAR_0623902 [Daucus carota subsp. sativus]